MEWTIENVLEGWISDRTISRRKRAFLKQMHEINVKSDGIPLVCPSHISSALDLPNGSAWPYVVADLLDYLEGQEVGHTVTRHKLALGIDLSHQNINEKKIDESKIINELNVLDDLISNKEISDSRKSFLIDKHQEILGNMEHVMVHGVKYEGNVCPNKIIRGLNDLAKAKEYPKSLKFGYPYWEYAIAFALDLINWTEKDEILESELSERINQINYQMNYFSQELEGIYDF